MSEQELTNQELNQFLDRRKDIKGLIDHYLCGFKIIKADRRAADKFDKYDLVVSRATISLSVIDFDSCSCEEGKNDLITIEFSKENSEVTVKEVFEGFKDFRRYLFCDSLNTIQFYEVNPIWRRDKEHKYTTIKRNAQDKALEIIVTEEKQIQEITKKPNGWYDSKWSGKTPVSECHYRFYKYIGKCTEENCYEGKSVTVLFPDEETRKTELIETSPVIFNTMPYDDTVVPERYDSLFFLNAPFNRFEPGETVLIRSGIFAAIEAFAKDYRDIAFKYIPQGDFLSLYADTARNENGKAINGGIFFKNCRIIPTDKGFISIKELFDTTEINSDPPKYKLEYKDKETLGEALSNFRFALKGRDYVYYVLKRKIGKLLLWDKYGDGRKQIYDDILKNKGTGTLSYELLHEYMGNTDNHYVEVTEDMFKHGRKKLFETPNEPVNDHVRSVLMEKEINAASLFAELQEMPWHKSFLTPDDNFSTILDEYIEELSEISVNKDENGEIRTKPFMDFSSLEGFTELPQKLRDKCEKRLGEDSFYNEDLIEEMSADEIMKKAMYYDYKGDKIAYFWNSDSEDGHLVVFGEKAFDKVLELLD